MGPSDVATEIRGCSGTSIGKEPSIQLHRVAGTIALQSDVDGLTRDARRRRVTYGEGGRRGGRVAASVGHREGHLLRLGVSATWDQSRAVVRPDEASACVGGRGSSIAGEPVCELGRVIGSVTLVGGISGRSRNGRGRVVDNGHDRGRRRCIVTIVGHRQGNGVRTEISTGEAGLAGRQRHGATSVARAIVNVTRDHRSVSTGIQGHGVVLGQSRRIGRVLNRERGRSRGLIAAKVRGREGHRDGTRGSAEVAHNGPRAIVVAEGGAAAIVVRGRTGEVGEPGVQVRRVAGSIALHGQIRRRRGDSRSGVVLDGKGGRRRARVARRVGGREDDLHGSGPTTSVGHGRKVIAPGHATTVVRGSGSCIVAQPRHKGSRVARPVTLDGHVGSRGSNGRGLVVLDDHIEGSGRAVSMDVGRGVGHRGRAQAEGRTGGNVSRQGRDRAVVRGGRIGEGHDRITCAGVRGHRHIGHGRNHRGLGVGHDYIEANGGRIVRSVRGGIGHRRGAHGKGVSRAVGARQGLRTIVRGGRRRPRDGRTAVACVIGRGKITGVARDGRGLVVDNRYREGGRDGVVCCIRCGVGHRRRAHIEGRTRIVGAGHRRTAIVGGCRRGPADCGAAHAGVIVDRDVRRGPGKDRILAVGYGDVKASRGLIALGVLGSIGHRGRAHRVRCAIGLVRGEARHAAVVRGGRFRPGHHSGTLTRVIAHRNVGRQAINGRSLTIGNGHSEGGGHSVPRCIHGRIAHGGAAYVEEVTAIMGGGETRHTAVVARRRRRPSDGCATRIVVGRGGDVGGHIGNGWVLVIDHHHIEEG